MKAFQFVPLLTPYYISMNYTFEQLKGYIRIIQPMRNKQAHISPNRCPFCQLFDRLMEKIYELYNLWTNLGLWNPGLKEQSSRNYIQYNSQYLAKELEADNKSVHVLSEEEYQLRNSTSQPTVHTLLWVILNNLKGTR